MTLADRMIVMNGGVADQIGAPLEVYERPATAFVAGFIGSPATNFFDAGLLADATMMQGLSDNERAALSGHGATVGVRPEHLKLSSDGSGFLTLKISYTEALGAETLLHGRLSSGEAITIRQSGHLPLPQPGQEFGVSWDDGAVMVFDSDGQRI